MFNILIANFRFFFAEPHTEILGGADMHVDWGSTINLTCVSKFSPAPPSDVIWYQNDKVI
jgi:hypothetical protein